MTREASYDELTVNQKLDYPENRFDDGGTVAAGEQDLIVYERLADGETLEIFKIRGIQPSGSGFPTDFDIVLIEMDSPSKLDTVFSGDGSNLNQVGDPILSYQNTTGSPQDVAIGMDNGKYNSGTGSVQDYVVSGEYRVV